MAIAFRSQTSLGGTASAVSVVLPAGATQGDVLVVDIITSGATVSAVPSGWTQITNVQTGLTARLFSYWHAIGASDPGPWSFTLSASGSYSHICACYSGVDTTTPLDVAATTVGSNTAGTSIVVPAVSPTHTNTMLHSGVGEGATNRTITNPTGMTSITEVTSGRRQEAAWQAIAATGSTGTRTWTFSGTAVYNAYMVPLRAATAIPATFSAPTATGTGAASATFTGASGGGGGPAVFDSISAAAQITNASTVAPTVPATVNAGDLLICFISHRDAGVSISSFPSGWAYVPTQAGSINPVGTGTEDPCIMAAYLVATGSEGGTSPTFTLSAAGNGVAAIARYTGVDTSTPFDVNAVSNVMGVAGTGIPVPQLTTVTDGALVVVFVGGDEEVTSADQFTSWPASLTERADMESGTSNVFLGVADVTQTTAGTFNGSNGTVTATSDVWATLDWALKPAPSGGGTSGTFSAPTATGTGAASATETGQATATAPTATGTGGTVASFAGQGRISAATPNGTGVASATFTGRIAATFTAPTATGTGSATGTTATGQANLSGTATGVGVASASLTGTTGAGFAAPTATGIGAASAALKAATVFSAPTATGTGASSAAATGQGKLTAPTAIGAGAASATATGQGRISATTPNGTGAANATLSGKVVATFSAPAATGTGVSSVTFQAGGTAFLTAPTATGTGSASAAMRAGAVFTQTAGQFGTGPTGQASASFRPAARLAAPTASGVGAADGDLFAGQPLPPAVIVFPASAPVDAFSASNLVTTFDARAPGTEFSGGNT